jgi:hypothetical protein
MPRDHAASDEHTLLALECPECHQYTEQPLAWLLGARSLACDACGSQIEIGSGQNRLLIDTHASLNRAAE